MTLSFPKLSARAWIVVVVFLVVVLAVGIGLGYGLAPAAKKTVDVSDEQESSSDPGRVLPKQDIHDNVTTEPAVDTTPVFHPPPIPLIPPIHIPQIHIPQIHIPQIPF